MASTPPRLTPRCGTIDPNPYCFRGHRHGAVLPPLIKLDLLRNGLHSLYHGIEHLHEAFWAERPDFLAPVSGESATYDPEDGVVTRKDVMGRTSWSLVAFSRPPKIYGIKFALLHLIQATELIVKAYLARDSYEAIREKPSSDRTISMRTAVTRLTVERPGLLDPEHLDLVLKASELRNAIEHNAFCYEFDRMKAMSSDFLAICSYLTATLHSIDISEVFSYDAYTDGPDKLGEYLAAVLTDRTRLSDEIVSRHAAEWAARNPTERLLVCLQCGARGGLASTGLCVVCGSDVDVELSEILDELASLGDSQGKANARTN